MKKWYCHHKPNVQGLHLFGKTSCVPSQSFRTLLREFAPLLQPGQMHIDDTKGLEVVWHAGTGVGEEVPPLTRECIQTMSELIQTETCLKQIGCFSGPNLVSELMQQQPAAAVLASNSSLVLEQGKRLLGNERFQVYTYQDLLGVELCGSLENIIAIAVGCLGGLGYGENAQASLISRGLIEMIYIGKPSARPRRTASRTPI